MAEKNKAPFALRQIRYEIRQAEAEVKRLEDDNRDKATIDAAKDELKRLQKILDRMTSGSKSDRVDERRDFLGDYYNELGGAWVARLVKEDPELRTLVEQAIRKGWDQQEFSDALFGTDWWRDPKRSGSWKSAFQMEFNADPTAWNDALEQAKISIAAVADSLYNMSIPDDVLNTIARRYLYQGWSANDNRGLKEYLATQFKKSGAEAGGSLLDTQRTLDQYAKDYGVPRPDGWSASTAQKILDPRAQFTADDAINQLIADAESLYPVFAGKLSKDVSVRDVAAGYISQLSRYLEIPDPKSVELTDPLLQKAFTNLDDKSNPSLMPLWQFTQAIKQDSRWQYTTNALDAYSSIGSDLARMMGFVR